MDDRMRVPRRIGRGDLERLWDAARGSRQESNRYLLLALLGVFYGTGARRGEVERLSVEDWDRESGVLRFDGRKTQRERRIPVGAAVWRCLEAYLPYRHNLLEKSGRLQERALFVNRYGERLSGIDIYKRVRSLARRAKVPLVRTHQFRHTCASDLLEKGVCLHEVQGVLGHASIGSTMRYTHVADPERVRAAGKHPINGFLTDTDLRERAS
jgi:integrase/recombinase XerC